MDFTQGRGGRSILFAVFAALRESIPVSCRAKGAKKK
jgi:hypothetical protein